MERKGNFKALVVVALLIAVAGLTVAFAAMSKTLTINGTASVDAAKWDIHLENLRTEASDRGKVIVAPELAENGTYIDDFEVTVSKPGDYVYFYFDIVNGGDIDAKFTDYFISDFSVGSVTDEIREKFFEAIYVEADWNGDGITTQEERVYCGEQGLALDFVIELGIDDVLKSKDSVTNCYFGVAYREDATELPKGNVSLKINLQMLFEQV